MTVLAPHCTGTILRVLNDETFAQDTLQDVFVKVWSRIQQFDEKKGRLFTWLLNISRNAALDVRRSAQFKNRDKIQSMDSSVHNVQGGNLSIERIGVKEIVEKLGPEQKQIIDLIYYDGYTQSEVADELELPLGTVKSRARAALKKLRQAF